MKNKPLLVIFAIILAGFVSEFIHTHFGTGVPLYGTFIDTIAYLTKPEEAVGVAIIYYLLGDRLPTHSRMIKGILLGLLMVRGQLFRELFIDLLLPNTFKEAFLFELQAWAATFVTTIIIAWFIKPKYASDKKIKGCVAYKATTKVS